MAAIAGRYPDAAVVVADPSTDDGTAPGHVAWGPDAVIAAAATAGCTVVNGVVGAVGLRASIAALEAGNRLALANKESLVAGGELVLAAAARGGGELLPVDSEHAALFQCLVGEPETSVTRLILTASGGPFRGRSRASLEHVTPDEALRHPTWAMGNRITIDSATLVNKGLEVIEAHHLFGVPYDMIDVVVHPQSIVHSLVEFEDGSLKAHLGEPDMRVPIQYALTHPDRAPGPLAPFDLTGQDLTFEAPDRHAFPALDLAFHVGRTGGTAPAVFNAADEVVVAAFLDGSIGFLEIPAIIEETVTRVGSVTDPTLEAVIDADAAARRVAAGLVGR